MNLNQQLDRNSILIIIKKKERKHKLTYNS
jgi:hypothetical protein